MLPRSTTDHEMTTFSCPPWQGIEALRKLAAFSGRGPTTWLPRPHPGASRPLSLGFFPLSRKFCASHVALRRQIRREQRPPLDNWSLPISRTAGHWGSVSFT